jgi:Arc/MetJ-type ribon-helix-helix transcriptional regulator
MATSLTPETEQIIQHEFERGDFESPDQVVATAMELLRVEQDIVAGRRAEIEAKLSASMAAAERGETITFDELFASMDEWKAQLT